MKIAIIATLLEGNAIGYQNHFLYCSDHIKKRFDNLTLGHSIIIGRKTYESLPDNSFPGRKVIVLTSDPGWKGNGVSVAHNFGQALHMCSTIYDSGMVFVVGGESVYKLAISLADEMYLAFVHKKVKDFDKQFPAYDKSKWITERIERLQTAEKQMISFVKFNRAWYKGRHI